MPEPHILVAGIGNIFLGDDAFGVEVARRLSQKTLPPNVYVVDFGIRSYDLAFAILEDPAATILVDATPRGEPPGSLYLLELSMDEVDYFQNSEHEISIPDAHSMNPVAALQLVKQYGGAPRNLYLVGCEPATLAPTDGNFTLSESLRPAVDAAIEMVLDLIKELEASSFRLSNVEI